MDASVGLVIQCVGIVLLTLLSFCMMSSIRGASERYWTVAWSCLSLSLSSLIIALYSDLPKKLFYSLYFLGEYAFAVMFALGCRHRATGARLSSRSVPAFIPLIAIAVALPWVSDDFNDLVMIHAFIMACLFAASFFALRPARYPGESSLGLSVTSVALVLLSVDSIHHLLVFGARDGAWGVGIPTGYLKYTPIISLILETMLGFGTVIILMESVRREVEQANRELIAARERAELLARVDPLTEALNRHAFHSLLSRGGSERANTSGCVAIIDLDDLKLINDRHGHAAGDRAIRSVASTVRSLIRADDLLFRWGGDEFLILMLGMPEAKARRRLGSLDADLSESDMSGAPTRVYVSHGLARFETLEQLHHAIEEADREMYERKQARKQERRARALEFLQADAVSA